MTASLPFNCLQMPKFAHWPVQADGEEPAKPAPKAKNPLDLLPPSKMILDSWKRLYSNTPASQFKEICVNGLWNGANVPNSPTQEVSFCHCTAAAAFQVMVPSLHKEYAVMHDCCPIICQCGQLMLHKAHQEKLGVTTRFL